MIPFIDLQAQRRRLGTAVTDAIERVLDRGDFVSGVEVGELEAALAAHSGARHVVSCASGTDALLMVLMAWGVGRGDAVFVPSFTFAATAEAVVLTGATPVFVDVDPVTFNLDAGSLADAIDAINATEEVTARAVIAVDLFGQPADYDAICSVAQVAEILVLADSAQSYGATRGGSRAGTWGDAATTSFFPAKPLGCYGDGGAVFTPDGDTAAIVRSISVHGAGDDKYDNVRIGLTGRLDTIQAAILLAKLAIFDDELGARDRVADRYRHGLAGFVRCPEIAEGCTTTWAQYTVLVDDREEVASRLRASGIPTAVYYGKPLHLQRAFRSQPCAPSGLAVSEELAHRALSLPMHAYLDEATQERIIAAVLDAVR